MVQVRTTLDLHTERFDRFTSADNPGMVRQANRYARGIERTAKRRAPVDSGLLRASISSDVFVERNFIIVTVTVGARYGIYQARGTGIYGPERHLLTPRTAKAFRFQPKQPGPLVRGGRRASRGRRAVVFASTIRGTPFNRFLVIALAENVPAGSVQYFGFPGGR
jgi:hypothetical protein